MANNLLGVWSTIGSIVLAILILLAMITVHEFGHYLAGKILKFKIDEFSIGFGPAFVKIKRKKSGELFAVRLLPLGGFCAFHGEDGLDEEQPEKKPEPSEEPFKELEEGAGTAPLAESTETVIITPAPTEAEPLPEQTAAILEAPATPEKPKKRDWNDDGAFTHMKPWKRIIVLVAGAFMNYLLAVLLILLCFSLYGQTMVGVRYVEPTEEIPIENCLQDRDVFLKVNGQNLYLTTDLARALKGGKAGDKVKMEVSRVTEGNKRERMKVEIILRADVEVKNSTDIHGVWKALGVKYTETEEGGYYEYGTLMQKFGFFETLGRSFVYSVKIAGSIFQVIGELFTGRLGINALGGPVTTITTTATVAAQSFRSFLEIAGFIGVNLAVFNLLPIPALDGSKVIFTVIEWIRGKPISRKVEAIIHAVGFVFLIGFAILVDVLQFI